MTILMAEDNPVNQMFIRELLEQSGHTVITAHTGLRAVKVLEQSRVDAVLMDIQMPEMDGIEATRIIRDAASGGIDPDVPYRADGPRPTWRRESFLGREWTTICKSPWACLKFGLLRRVLVRKGRMLPAVDQDDPGILDYAGSWKKAGATRPSCQLIAPSGEKRDARGHAQGPGLGGTDGWRFWPILRARRVHGGQALSAAAMTWTHRRAGDQTMSAQAMTDVEMALRPVLARMKAKLASHAEPVPTV
jgi:hypothetical protein